MEGMTPFSLQVPPHAAVTWCWGPLLEQDGPWHTAAVGDANDSRQPLVKLDMHPILQVAKVGAFTSQQVTELSSQIDELQQRAAEASPGSKEALTKVRHCACVVTCQKSELRTAGSRTGRWSKDLAAAARHHLGPQSLLLHSL